MVFGFLSRMAAPLLGTVGGWVVDKVKGWFGGSSGSNNRGRASNVSMGSEQSTGQPGLLSRVGQTAASFIDRDKFLGTMKQFGTTLDSRLQGTSLAKVPDGSSLGNVFYNSMKSAMDYLKNGDSSKKDAYLPSEQQMMGQRPAGDVAMRDAVEKPAANSVAGGGGGSSGGAQPF